MKYKNILITGSAGFIGFHLSKYLLENYNNVQVIGIDNLNNYYNPLLKEKRNDILKNYENYNFIKADFSNWNDLENNLKNKDIDLIVHLGAQAGVRYSLENPWAYEKSNLLGTMNIFELARKLNIEKVVYASSSSVYGGNKKIPFSEDDIVDKPVSLYAATKKSNELMAHTYHHLYDIKMIGLRFFTVYGEYGRPDMAYFKFAKKILSNEPIDIYNYGDMERDFTYISDVVDGIISSIEKDFDYEIFNLGNSRPVKLMYFVELLEKYLNKEAEKNFLPMQDGDVLRTYADLNKSSKLLNYNPKVSIEEGLKRFCNWFLENKEWLLVL
ncbi:NAD-dependent epimerase/dehydratase [Methanococcus aeolicus Nankai-3]|uniref:NAD-dependent epimerase/dehydratase n=1 Tax=Methanococcus aeolicus (strain ATCC BAA-1280 / DSM 17508 / OCM 812 / Nankai-3) TaxID=419665 RepID=A6UU29_META3|nr:NAD-dependent epimerase/dehydratase family protein [Methanococcus aeolicus]ABR56001.1 NAD-dependent epimerase/dehydratase [Methanococcus aeolicus Nankai-3]